jgi:hypothetical protein
VKYFLHETGRENITPSELAPIRELNRAHYPGRVMREIDTAVARFRRGGRDPAALTFGYLHDSLKNQPGRGQKPRASPLSAAEKRQEEKRRRENVAWEYEQEEEIRHMLDEMRGGG